MSRRALCIRYSLYTWTVSDLSRWFRKFRRKLLGLRTVGKGGHVIYASPRVKKKASRSAALSLLISTAASSCIPFHSQETMLEPITIITAVVGIVAASTKLIPILATLANFQDAPKHAQDILLQVAGIQSIAKQLQAFIERRVDAPQVRQYLINVEHIQVILVECVITYSELEPIMDSLGITPARGFWNRIKWKYKENDISRILDRLHDHRLSLSLMLTILNGYAESCSDIFESQWVC